MWFDEAKEGYVPRWDGFSSTLARMLLGIGWDQFNIDPGCLLFGKSWVQFNMDSNWLALSDEMSSIQHWLSTHSL